MVVGGGFGTAYPAAELDEPVADAMFARVLDEFAPDVVHVQEMLGHADLDLVAWPRERASRSC